MSASSLTASNAESVDDDVHTSLTRPHLRHNQPRSPVRSLIPQSLISSSQLIHVDLAQWIVLFFLLALILVATLDYFARSSVTPAAGASTTVVSTPHNTPATDSAVLYTASGLPAAALPAVRTDGYYTRRREEIRSIVKSIIAQHSPLSVVFFGDSITARWHEDGKQVWAKRIEPLGAINAGIDGDRTPHVIDIINELMPLIGNYWKSESPSAPKVVVLLIGTNNAAYSQLFTPRDTVIGIQTAVHNILEHAPTNTHVLVLHVFPRTDIRHIGSAQERNTYVYETNKILSEIPSNDHITILNINEHLLDITATNALKLAENRQSAVVLRKGYFPDGLHLSDIGYEEYATAILPVINKWLSSS